MQTRRRSAPAIRSVRCASLPRPAPLQRRGMAEPALPPPPISPAAWMGLLVTVVLLCVFVPGLWCLAHVQTPSRFDQAGGNGGSLHNARKKTT